MPSYNNALTSQPANRLAYQDSIGATPRNEYLGALADYLAQTYSPERTQQMQGVARFFNAPEVSQTLDRLSYGEPLTTGAGMTTRVRPEALDAAMAVAPMGKPVTMATLQAARAARQAALAGGMAGERYAERVVPQIMQRGGLGAEMLGAMANRTVSPIDVYHGTPYKFDKFDSSKIGTGEGAQVYGHGLYMAEAPATAEMYQKTLAPQNYAAIIQNGRNDYSVVAKDGSKVADGVLLGQAHKAKDAFDATQTGYLYKADLPDKQISKMLDYDKPYSEQHPDVKAALDNIVQSEYTPKLSQMVNILNKNPMSDSLKLLNDQLGGQEIAANYLKEAGIPGIKYLDQQSKNAGGWHLTSPDNTVRGKWMLKSSDYNSNGVFFDSQQEAQAALKEKLGKETRNFVVFPGEEQSMTILERNGQPVNALAKGKR